MSGMDRRLGVAGGTSVKPPCRVATTAAITLSGLQSVDGVTVASGDRVLVMDQADTVENGIYTVDTGPWRRALDFNGTRDAAQGTLVYVHSGVENGATLFSLATASPVIGTSGLVFGAVQRTNSTANLRYLWATGDAEYDTAALQTAVEDAPTGAIIDGMNTTFTLIVDGPDDTPFWYYAMQPSRGVYPAIRIERGDFTLRNFRFRMTRPAGTYVVGSRPTAFATDANMQRGTLRNIAIEGCEFDFKDSGDAALTYGLHLLGIWGLRIRNCQFLTSGTANEVTITRNGSNQLTAAWTAHGYEAPAIVRFTGDDLPPEVEPGRGYYLRPASGSDPDAFRVSEEYEGTVLQISAGTWSGTATATQILGRAITMDNCDDIEITDCDFGPLRQGFFLNANRNFWIDGERFDFFAEAIDCDVGWIGGGIVNSSFTNGFGEGQAMDLSPVQDFQIRGVKVDRAVQALQLYVKAHNAEDYEALYKGKYPWPCVFALGSPGTITSVATATGAPNTPCPIEEDGRFWIDEPDGAHTFPTGVAKFTTYRAKNVNPTTGTFQIYADTDGSKAAINFTGSVSGTFELRMISEAADITVCKDVIIDGLTITNGLGTDNDIMISTARAERAGTDRSQHLRGVGNFAQTVTMTNIHGRDIKRITVNEAQDITIRGVKLDDCTPGTDPVTGAALVLKQADNDTDAIANSSLSGTVEDVTVRNSQGMGVYIYRPARLTLDKITVDGYNLQEEDATAYGIRGAQMAGKSGLKTFGALTVRNGLSGGTVTAVDFWPEVASGTDGRFRFNGPFALETSGAIKIKGDLGALVTNPVARVIPSQTVGATAIQIPLDTDRLRGGKFLYASLQNLAEISGVSPNYSNLRIRKVDSASTISNITSAKAIDDVTVTVASSRDWNVDPTNAATDVLAGEYVYAELTRSGTGSTIPNLLLTYVFVPYL